MKTRATIIFLLIFFSLSLLSPKAYAKEAANSSESSTYKLNSSINPSDDYKYAFKRLQERIILLILNVFPDKKADYYQELLNTRLAELKNVVDSKDIANIERSSQRYFSTAGELVQFITDKKLNNKKGSINEQFSSHLPVLEILQNVYPANSAGWLFLRHDINYLKIYQEQLNI